MGWQAVKIYQSIHIFSGITVTSVYFNQPSVSLSLSLSLPLCVDFSQNFFLFKNIYFFICLSNRAIGLMSRVFANGSGTGVQSLVESYQRLKKWYLMPHCLALSIMLGSRVKWSSPGKGVAPFPTPRCSSCRKESLQVILD